MAMRERGGPAGLGFAVGLVLVSVLSLLLLMLSLEEGEGEEEEEGMIWRVGLLKYVRRLRIWIGC